MASKRPIARAKPLWDRHAPSAAARSDGKLGRLQQFFFRDVWEPDVRTLPFLRRCVFRVSRVLYLTVSGFLRDKCMFRSSALTYITVLSLVPLLALGFSVAKGFGALDKLKSAVVVPFIEEITAESMSEAPEGQTSDPVPGGSGSDPALEEEEEAGGLKQVLYKILDFVEGTDFKSLGALGLVALLFTAIKLIGTIEASLNEIWGAPRARSFTRKVADYLSMVTVAPLLVLAAVFLIGAAENNFLVTFAKEQLHLGGAIALLSRLTPTFVMWLAFTFIFVTLPNTPTKLSSSALGALLAAILWVVLNTLHIQFQVGTANYNAIYSGFAAFPIFLVWLYFSWVVVMLGAELAHAHQAEPNYRASAFIRSFDHSLKERVALHALARIAGSFVHGDPPWTALKLAEDLGVDPRPLDEVIDLLVEDGILAVSEVDATECFLPARSLDQLTVASVLKALGGDKEQVRLPSTNSEDTRVEATLASLRGDVEQSSHNLTLRDLAD